MKGLNDVQQVNFGETFPEFFSELTIKITT